LRCGLCRLLASNRWSMTRPQWTIPIRKRTICPCRACAWKSMPGAATFASCGLRDGMAAGVSAWVRMDMDVDAPWLGIHGTRRYLRGRQPAGRTARSRQSGIRELGMLMEQHKLGRGTILFRQMFSAESLTSPHPGFPERFQTGETYHDEQLVDHQHPHNVFAEPSALYTLPLSEKVSWELYGGPSAEPAPGPVTYLHRASAAKLPMAPLGPICRTRRTQALA
jgi:hypothetical protein